MKFNRETVIRFGIFTTGIFVGGAVVSFNAVLQTASIVPPMINYAPPVVLLLGAIFAALQTASLSSRH